MTTAGDPPDQPGTLSDRVKDRLSTLVASRRFQSWAARFPLTRTMARRDGERLFDLTAGFAYSQVLRAFVGLGLHDILAAGPQRTDALALRCHVPRDRMERLCRASVALGLLRRAGPERYALARLGAALRGVPGLVEMIRHHDILYRDLADAEGFVRGDTDPELAAFWPYVFGAGAEIEPETAARYSDLMAQSQLLVAEETLKAVDLSRARRVLDVGGGTGAFLAELGRVNAEPELWLFDLPAVAEQARARLDAAGLGARARVIPGDFRTDPLPEGADTISLVRVLYDHRDDTVAKLLRRIFAALPPGGRLVVSEPMSGGDRPSRSGDGYFALYCMAMGTGTVRAPAEISGLLKAAGFVAIRVHGMDRSFITQTVSARKP